LIFYLDTSVVVAALTKETGSDRIDDWLSSQRSEVAISAWVKVEVSSALAIKLRTGQISTEDRAAALTLFTRIAGESLGLLDISGIDFQMAARYADQHTLGLRAADALHLAICSRHGATLCTRDKRLGRAATALGLMATSL